MKAPMIGAKPRREIRATISWLMDRRLMTGTSGNVSCRGGDGFLITPTGIPGDEIGAADLVEMTAAGRPRGRRLPSSEWRMHRDIYCRRPEIGAVVHTHSTFATALSCLRRAVPAFHYMVAKAGGSDIRCARYATYGTEALSENALRALDGRRACLLANHGLVAIAEDLRAARLLAEEVEALCAQFVVARSVGAPVLLPAFEMKAVGQKFAGYGQKPDRRRR